MFLNFILLGQSTDCLFDSVYKRCVSVSVADPIRKHSF